MKITVSNLRVHKLIEKAFNTETVHLPSMIQMTMELPRMAMTRMRENMKVQTTWLAVQSSSVLNIDEWIDRWI